MYRNSDSKEMEALFFPCSTIDASNVRRLLVEKFGRVCGESLCPTMILCFEILVNNVDKWSQVTVS